MEPWIILMELLTMREEPCAFKDCEYHLSIIYGLGIIWLIPHTWSQDGGFLNNAYITLKKNHGHI